MNVPNIDEDEIERADDEFVDYGLDLDQTDVNFPSVDEGSLKNRISSLNEKQKYIFDIVNKQLNDPLSSKSPLKETILGPGGTGKSFLAEILKDLINLKYQQDPTDVTNLHRNFVMVCAPTGVAAKNIKGLTCHKALELPVEKFGIGRFQDLKGKKLEEAQRKWQYTKWLIIDELSMISYEQLRYINLRLQQIKNCNQTFGGINVILMGDLLQLKPIYGHEIYHQPTHFSSEPNLWQMFNINQLERNERQKGDMEYGDLCMRARIGKLDVNDLELLNSRLSENVKNLSYFDDAIHIYPRKYLVFDYNEKMKEKLKQSGSRTYKINSLDLYSDGPKIGKNVDSKDLYSDEEQCGGMPKNLELALGSRIMLRRNLNFSNGLVNGSIGTITGFEWNLLNKDQQQDGDLPKNILVKFDDPTIALLSSDLDKIGDSVKISCQTTRFEGKKGEIITRTMLPIILAWAVTIHKVQGITLEKAVIHLNDCFAYSMEYVALSRLKSLSGLLLTGIDYSRLASTKYVNPNALKILGL